MDDHTAPDPFPDAFPGRYWHTVEDAKGNALVQCDVCPRACKIRDGQRGLCFVRGAQNGEVVLTTYGRSSGFCIDPIEKKPLNHFCRAPRSCRSARRAAI